MESRIETIRNHIYRKYDEFYLQQILIDFYNQQLNLFEFNVDNRNVSKILNHFFDDLLYKAKSKNGRYSPNDIVSDDKLLNMALEYIDEHRDFYQQKSDVANLRDFFFSSSMVGKVTNFNPVIARKIYEKYAPFKNATILDYSCGYGSRMLGALSSQYNYNYIGIDPYKELYLRLLIFSEWILSTLQNSSSSEIFNCGSEEFIPTLANTIDLSFSSPPYYNYETYTDSDTQSYIKYPSYDDWLNGYVYETIKNIFQYTKDGGLHLVNLEDTKRIKLVQDWIEIALSIGFKLEKIEQLNTKKRATSKNQNKLLIFRK